MFTAQSRASSRGDYCDALFKETDPSGVLVPISSGQYEWADACGSVCMCACVCVCVCACALACVCVCVGLRVDAVIDEPSV